MQTLKTPFVGSFNTRNFSTSNTKDQVFKSCLFTKIVNPATNNASWYVEKRDGLNLSSVQSFGPSGATGDGSAVHTSPSLSVLSQLSFTWVVAFGTTNSSIFVRDSNGIVNCGTISGQTEKFIETILGGITYFMFGETANGTGWFLPSDAYGSGSIPTFTANRTSANVTLASVSSFTGLYVGQLLTGTGIAVGARIASMNTGAGTLDMTIAATSGSATSTTITREAIAKIIDADFPRIGSATAPHTVGCFAEMDGYVFTFTSDAKIYNSDLNSVTSWSASNFITANISTDKATGVFKHKNQIACAGQASWEFFYNAGNAAGSILSSSPTLATKVGVPNGGCVTSAGDTIYFISNDNCLWRFNGFTPEKIVAEGSKLGDSPNGGDDRVFTTMSACTKLSQIGIFISGGANVQKMYFPELNIFIHPGMPAFSCFGGDIGNPILVDHSGVCNSYFWGLGAAVYQDNSASYTMSIQIATDMGTNKRKFATELRVEADVQASGSLAVSYSDDDGTTFSTARNIALTSIGAMKLTRLGSWKGTRVWKFEHSANTAFRAKLLEIDYEVAA